MGKPQALALVMTSAQVRILEQQRSKHKQGQQICKRIDILLSLEKGNSHGSIQRDLGCSSHTVLRWRERWSSNYEELLQLEKGIEEEEELKHSDLESKILELLSDKPRSGTPVTFSLSQRQEIVALSSRKPKDEGVQMNKWTHEMLAKIAIKKGIVSSISPSHLGKILKKSGDTT